MGAYWLHRSWVLSVGILLSLLLIINLGYWEETVQTLALVVFSTTVCLAVGVPVGIAAAHRPWLYTGIRPVLDLMQTIPTFVYLIPTLVLFGLGVVPGANIGDAYAVFEAVHGSAPDIAGKGIANPIGQIWSGAMMLDHLGHPEAAAAVEQAIETVLENTSLRTPDMGGKATTMELGAAIAEAV